MTDGETQNISLGGARLPATLASDVFYGFRLDSTTGHLNIEVIGNGAGVVQLPQPGQIDPLDYKQWLWTPDTLQFQFNSTNGHLEMTVL
jgi:hypothetical protein